MSMISAASSMANSALASQATAVQRQAEQAESKAKELKQEADRATQRAVDSQRKANGAQWDFTRARTSAERLSSYHQLLTGAVNPTAQAENSRAASTQESFTYAANGSPSRPPSSSRLMATA